MGHEEDRGLRLAPEVEQEVLHIHARHRIERAEGFVHQNDSWSQNERLGDGNPLPHASGELVRVFGLIARDGKTHVADPLSRQLLANPAGNALALKTESHVVQHAAMIEAGVVLKDHAPVRPRILHGLAENQNLAAGWRMLRAQARNQPQDGALAAAAGPQDANEFSFFHEVPNHEAHVANRRELTGGANVEGFRHAAKFDDVGQSHFLGLLHVIKHVAQSHGRGWVRRTPRLSRSSCRLPS